MENCEPSDVPPELASLPEGRAKEEEEIVKPEEIKTEEIHQIEEKEEELQKKQQPEQENSHTLSLPIQEKLKEAESDAGEGSGHFVIDGSSSWDSEGDYEEEGSSSEEESESPEKRIQILEPAAQNPPEPSSSAVQSAGNPGGIEQQQSNPPVAEVAKVDVAKRGRTLDTFNLSDDITVHHIWWVLSFTANAIGMLLYWTEWLPETPDFAALFNILVGALCRETEIIVWLHYSTPYWPKRGRYYMLRLLHCIGGLHVASMVSGFVWITIYMTRHIIYPTVTGENPWPLSIVITGSIIHLSMLDIIVTAIPYARKKFHYLFE